MTPNGTMAIILHYFTELGSFGSQLHHSGRPTLSATNI